MSQKLDKYTLEYVSGLLLKHAESCMHEVDQSKLLLQISVWLKAKSESNEHADDLTLKIQRQAHELSCLNQAARDRNLQLDALKIVWCSGGCEKGMSRYFGEYPTEDIVLAAIVNATRMYNWFVTHEGRAVAGTDQAPRVLEGFERVRSKLGVRLIQKLAELEAKHAR